MQKPKMILFDYGQTLADEPTFDPVAGNRALLQYAVRNKCNRTAEDISAAALEIDTELGRPPEKRHEMQIEVPNHIFCRYLFESMGIDLPLTPHEIDRVFWDAAAPGVPTEGISGFLRFLAEHGIRIGVISNISYCGAALAERIATLLPNHGFELILATSDYIFRKPNRRIFDLALEKAELQPQEVWYIGDNYDCDIVGARNAGVFPVWYTGAQRVTDQPDDTVLTITHWRNLEKIITDMEEYK